jgi:dihydrolipoamide dehydrogenase
MNISSTQSDFGIEASGQHDFGAVVKRSRGVADKMSKGVQFLMRKNKIDVINGLENWLPKEKLK